MKIIAIIPARGGSKSIPGKNIKSLKGRPLIEYIAKAALGSKFIDRVFLSTENKEIKDIGLKIGLEVPFMRSEDLARDDTPTLPVIQEMVKLLEEKNIYNPDIIVTLQATSPLCTSDHIDEALSIFMKDQDADSLLSVEEVPHNMNPYSVMKLVNKKYLEDFIEQENPILRRQDKKTFYARNGAIYITKRNLLNYGLFGGKILFSEMSRSESIDIDDLEDWQNIENKLNK